MQFIFTASFFALASYVAAAPSFQLTAKGGNINSKVTYKGDTITLDNGNAVTIVLEENSGYASIDGKYLENTPEGLKLTQKSEASKDWGTVDGVFRFGPTSDSTTFYACDSSEYVTTLQTFLCDNGTKVTLIPSDAGDASASESSSAASSSTEASSTAASSSTEASSTEASSTEASSTAASSSTEASSTAASSSTEASSTEASSTEASSSSAAPTSSAAASSSAPAQTTQTTQISTSAASESAAASISQSYTGGASALKCGSAAAGLAVAAMLM